MKSGLRSLFRAPEVPFSVPPKWLKQGHFSLDPLLSKEEWRLKKIDPGQKRTEWIIDESLTFTFFTLVRAPDIPPV